MGDPEMLEKNVKAAKGKRKPRRMLPDAEPVVHSGRHPQAVVLGALPKFGMPELSEIAELGAKAEAFRDPDLGPEARSGVSATLPLMYEFDSIHCCRCFTPKESPDGWQVGSKAPNPSVKNQRKARLCRACGFQAGQSSMRAHQG